MYQVEIGRAANFSPFLIFDAIFRLNWKKVHKYAYFDVNNCHCARYRNNTQKCYSILKRISLEWYNVAHIAQTFLWLHFIGNFIDISLFPRLDEWTNDNAWCRVNYLKWAFSCCSVHFLLDFSYHNHKIQNAYKSIALWFCSHVFFYFVGSHNSACIKCNYDSFLANI